MSDVAQKAGVSVSTVSKVLSGHGVALQLNVDTIERVQKAAHALGYVPNAVARELRSNRTRRVGLLLSGYQDPGIPPEVHLSLEGGLLFGLMRAARETQLSALTVYPTDPNAPADPKLFLDGRVDGLIVQSDPWGVNLLQGFADLTFPVIGVWTQRVHEGMGFVDVDQTGGTRSAIEHLLALGHRQIAFVGPRLATNPYDNFHLRYQGYRQALDQAGLSFQPDWHVEDADGLVPLVKAGQVTAAFVVNDRRAKPLAEALNEAAIRIPEDLSLVSFDNVMGTEFIAGGLTTVHNPVQEIGAQALRNLLALMDGASPESCRSVIKTQLAVRRSTALPSGAR